MLELTCDTIEYFLHYLAYIYIGKNVRSLFVCFHNAIIKSLLCRSNSAIHFSCVASVAHFFILFNGRCNKYYFSETKHPKIRNSSVSAIIPFNAFFTSLSLKLPSKSTKKQYSHCLPVNGIDSILVIFTLLKMKCANILYRLPH